MEERHGRKEIVRLLLEYGVDAAFADENGSTALDWARVHSRTDVADFLKLCIDRMAEGTLADLEVPGPGNRSYAVAMHTIRRREFEEKMEKETKTK